MSTTTPEAKLKELGIELPAAPKPVAAYVPVVRTGNLLFVAGQLPGKDGKLLAVGAVGSGGAGGAGVTTEAAAAAARQCAVNLLAVVKAEVGDLSKVRRVVKLGVFVACENGYVDQPKVANGASELMVAVFGEAGKHARAAVGTNALPLGATVEVDGVFEVE